MYEYGTPVLCIEWLALVKNEWMKGKDIYRDIIQTIKKEKRGKRGNCGSY